MTDQQLRDLLHERVADVTMPDMSDRAWRTGRRARRRDRVAVVGAAVVLSAGVATGVTVLGDRGGSVQPAPAPGTPTATTSSPPSASATASVEPGEVWDPVPSNEPDATYQGVPVWWSPDERQELTLPTVASQLPPVIDLGVRVKAIDYAVAAFSVDEGQAVLLTGPSGGQVSVDISFLDDVTKPNGYSYRPVHEAMLSPTGRYLVFPQDGSVEIYDVAKGSWHEIDTGGRTTRFVAWVNDTSFILPDAPGGLGYATDVDGQPAGRLELTPPDPGFDVGSAAPYGRTRTGPLGRAQTWGMGADLPVRPGGPYVSQPDFLGVDDEGSPKALAFMWTVGDGSDGGRFKNCCPVASWLDDTHDRLRVPPDLAGARRLDRRDQPVPPGLPHRGHLRPRQLHPALAGPRAPDHVVARPSGRPTRCGSIKGCRSSSSSHGELTAGSVGSATSPDGPTRCGTRRCWPGPALHSPRASANT